MESIAEEEGANGSKMNKAQCVVVASTVIKLAVTHNATVSGQSEQSEPSEPSIAAAMVADDDAPPTDPSGVVLALPDDGTIGRIGEVELCLECAPLIVCLSDVSSLEYWRGQLSQMIGSSNYPTGPQGAEFEGVTKLLINDKGGRG